MPATLGHDPGGRRILRTARGRLRGCQYHKREKRAVWFARIGIRGPAAKLGRRTARPTAPRPGQTGGDGPDRTLTVDKPVADTFTIVCNVVGLVGTVVSTVVGVVGLVLDVT